MTRRLLAVIALAALAAACAPLPRPFQPGDKAALDLRQIAARAAVVVSAPEGAVPGKPKAFATALGNALMAEGVLATTHGGGPLSRWVSGRAEVTPQGADTERLDLIWTVTDPEGGGVVREKQQLILPSGAWAAGDPETIGRVVGGIAPRLAERLLGPRVEQVAMPGFPGASLAVRPPLGAPGDGSAALFQAMERELRHLGLPVTARPGPHDLVVDGLVSMDPGVAPGWETVHLVWIVKRSSGEEIGRITQENDVPSGALDGAWGAAAGQAAQAAASGIGDLIAQAGAISARR